MGMRAVTKPVRRPKKTGKALRRRQKVQRNRLIALGVPEEKVLKLNSFQLRAMLKYPAKLRKTNA